VRKVHFGNPTLDSALNKGLKFPVSLKTVSEKYKNMQVAETTRTALQSNSRKNNSSKGWGEYIGEYLDIVYHNLCLRINVVVKV